MNEKLTWREHFNMVHEYIEDYLSSTDVRDLVPGELEFHVDDSNPSINAYVYPTTEQNYRIVFSAGLVKALTTESYSIVECSPLIFESADRSDKQVLEACQILLLFIWIDFIFHHEFAHVYCGHFKLLSEDAKWREFKSHEEVETLPVGRYELQRLEAHADRVAASNLLGQFARLVPTACGDIYGNQDAARFLKDYLLAIFYLFRFLEEIEGRENYDDATHPAPFVRANIFWHFLKLTYPNVDAVPPLSEQDLKTAVYSAFVEFYSLEYHFTAEEINKRMLEVEAFMNTVRDVLRSLGLGTQ